MSKDKKLKEAYSILVDLGMPRSQLNNRTALCLLALLNLTPDRSWRGAQSPMMGITPIMEWAMKHYQVKYKPNTRETFRRQSMHQFVEAGIALYNPDRLDRAVNSPKAVYQIEPQLLELLKKFGTATYPKQLGAYLNTRGTLAKRYAKERSMKLVPLKLKNGKQILLSAGKHSELIKAIVEDFAPRYVPSGDLIYVGDTGDKFGYFDAQLLSQLGMTLDNHGKMPDVVIYYQEKNWLLLIESVTSHGPVDYKRRQEMERLFEKCTAGRVYVSAFPNRKVFLRYLECIAWETEVWIADAPSHLIHFNGSRFLGPY